jgi:hypothetical protein
MPLSFSVARHIIAVVQQSPTSFKTKSLDTQDRANLKMTLQEISVDVRIVDGN